MMEDDVRFRDVDPVVLLRVVDLLDGHGLMKPDWLVEQGLPEPLVRKYTRTHKSDWSSPKTMIFGPGGGVLEELQAVYGLELLAAMVAEFGLPARSCIGRGWQAREYQRVLREHLAGTTAANHPTAKELN